MTTPPALGHDGRVELKTDVLYYGDNLDILRNHIPDESIDLVYLDPPFNSKASYNVLFRESSGEPSAAQIEAFEDSWHWGTAAERAYEEVVVGPHVALARSLGAIVEGLGRNDVTAYLCMMAVRLVELHKVLKRTGTIYLHCDPTASHYLKLLMDAIFGPKRFMNEVCWKRSSAHSDTKQGMRRYGRIRDLLLVYTKSSDYTWNPFYTPYTEDYLDSEYRHVAPDGRRYKETDLTAAKPGGDTEYDWYVKRQRIPGARWEGDIDEEYKNPGAKYDYKAVRPYRGRYWGYSKENMIQFAREGHLIHRKTGMPRLVQYALDMPGVPAQDLWGDIPPVSGAEDLGIPHPETEGVVGARHRDQQ